MKYADIEAEAYNKYMESQKEKEKQRSDQQ